MTSDQAIGAIGVRRDIAAGGQGAPLVPAFHASLPFELTADQTRVINPKLESHGFSAWATPKTPKG